MSEHICIRNMFDTSALYATKSLYEIETDFHKNVFIEFHTCRSSWTMNVMTEKKASSLITTTISMNDVVQKWFISFFEEKKRTSINLLAYQGPYLWGASRGDGPRWSFATAKQFDERLFTVLVGAAEQQRRHFDGQSVANLARWLLASSHGAL